MATSRPIQCPSCGFQIQAEDMNLQTMAARCRVCHVLVDLRPGADAQPLPATGRRDSLNGAVLQENGTLAAALPLPVPLPPNLSVETVGGELRIERRWYAWTAFLMVFFCVMWFGFLAFWYAMAFAAGSRLMMLFPLIHVAAGLFIAYTAAAMFVNRTRIVAGRGRLTVQHGPLPWTGNRDISTSVLQQLYCNEQVNRGRNSTTITFDVMARTTEGRQLKLVTGLNDRDQALYIEQEIERHLKIVDQHVAGGIRR
ncbi:MAG TPA: hypothetical protein VF665_21555 [Longimicrobium sp.]|jgi:hypothetical protein|uniref:hypothetical protein n=1 Tax=Longimicrobium sp. TaxID=2029185 RepID=UPI002EDAE33D